MRVCYSVGIGNQIINLIHGEESIDGRIILKLSNGPSLPQ